MPRVDHKTFLCVLVSLYKGIQRQECIPVGCVPPTAVVIGGGAGGLVLIPLNFPLGCWPGTDPPQFPLGCGPGPDPPQFPPWVWAWTWSPSISPLGVGLDLIPLNFPLGCGPGSDPPSISPLGVGLEGGSPWLGGLPGRGVSLVGGALPAGNPPPVDRQTPVKT